MNNRYTAYSNFCAGLQQLLFPLYANQSIDKIFSEALLNLAKIDEQSDCTMQAEDGIRSGTYLDFCLFLNETQTKQLLEYLNSLAPDIGAKCLPDGNTSIEFQLKNAESPRYIRLDAEIARTKLLPLIKEYISQNAQQLKYKYAQYTYNEVLAHLKTIFDKYEMSATYSDCFEETICFLINRNMRMTSAVHQFFNAHVTRDVSRITLEYLGNAQLLNDTLNKETMPDLKTTVSRVRPSKEDPLSLEILMTVDLKQAQAVAKYFNRIKPGTAFVAPKQLSRLEVDLGSYYSTGLNTKYETLLSCIRVKNTVFFDPRFVFHIEDALNVYSKDIIQKYQKETKKNSIHP